MKYIYGFLALAALGLAVLAWQSRIEGSGDDDFELPDVEDAPQLFEGDTFSVHYARCKYQSHIEGSRYFLEIKNIAREGQSLPSIDSTGIEGEMNIMAWVRLRGVSPPRPSLLTNRNRPHEHVEREQERLALLEKQTWLLFQASETIIVSNIVVDSKTTNGFLADIQLRFGATDLDLAETLMSGGYIFDDVYSRDYGRRLP